VHLQEESLSAQSVPSARSASFDALLPFISINAIKWGRSLAAGLPVLLMRPKLSFISARSINHGTEVLVRWLWLDSSSFFWIHSSLRCRNCIIALSFEEDARADLSATKRTIQSWKEHFVNKKTSVCLVQQACI
jgi:hypothetical protein